MLSPGEQPRKPPITLGQVAALAIAALLAWQCVGAYEDYGARMKVREVLDNGAPLRPEIERLIAAKKPVVIKSMPAPSRYTESMQVMPDGTIVMRLKPGVSSGSVVTWKRVLVADRDWMWDCGGDLPSNHYPDCRGRD